MPSWLSAFCLHFLILSVPIIFFSLPPSSHLCLFVSYTLSVYVPLLHPLTLSLSVFHSLCVYACLSLSLTVCLFFCLCLSVSVCLSLSLYLSLAVQLQRKDYLAFSFLLRFYWFVFCFVLFLVSLPRPTLL